MDWIITIGSVAGTSSTLPSIFTIPSRAEIPRINAIAAAAPVPVSELADGDDGVDGEGV